MRLIGTRTASLSVPEIIGTRGALVLARFNRPVILLLTPLFLLGQPSMALARSLQGMDLCWKPELDMSDLIKGMPDLPKVSVQVEPFHDERPRRDIIGEAQLTPRVEKKSADGTEEAQADKQNDSRIPVTTDDNVADWATRHFAESLHDAGLKVVESGGDVKISGEVLHFTAVKGPDYNGDVSIRVAVENAGDVIWRGNISGWARKGDGDWDKGKPKRYCSILSDALIRAVASLVWHPRFNDALAGNITPQSAPPAASSPAQVSP